MIIIFEMAVILRGLATSNEGDDETPFRYAHAEIRTRVVVICGPTRYQLDTETLRYLEFTIDDIFGGENLVSYLVG